PTHVVLAFLQALLELDQEGGIVARHARYKQNQQSLVTGLRKAGLETLLADEFQSVIITSFLYPESNQFRFPDFYDRMKSKRFVLYPGKVSQANTFRIGNIGHVFPEDIQQLIRMITETLAEMGVSTPKAN
ncbi:MAG: 2-aminoethylphosphonate--pyruvate transaminase, partial [Planctomycetaceae bacterium]|nr:2-aminoethylphosphonate--pyruvate transaminase [Planctomycetaceae bacterium]